MHDMVAHDTWHMTLHTWHMSGGEHCVKIQVPSSNCLGVMVFWRFGGKGWIAKCVCRTAPATQGLLIRDIFFLIQVNQYVSTRFFCHSCSFSFLTA